MHADPLAYGGYRHADENNWGNKTQEANSTLLVYQFYLLFGWTFYQLCSCHSWKTCQCLSVNFAGKLPCFSVPKLLGWNRVVQCNSQQLNFVTYTGCVQTKTDLATKLSGPQIYLSVTVTLQHPSTLSDDVRPAMPSSLLARWAATGCSQETRPRPSTYKLLFTPIIHALCFDFGNCSWNLMEIYQWKFVWFSQYFCMF